MSHRNQSDTEMPSTRVLPRRKWLVVGGVALGLLAVLVAALVISRPHTLTRDHRQSQPGNMVENLRTNPDTPPVTGEIPGDNTTGPGNPKTSEPDKTSDTPGTVTGGDAELPPPTGSPKEDICAAAQLGDLASVRALVSADPKSIDKRNSIGLTPLHLSSRIGHADVVGYLLAHGADVNATCTGDFFYKQTSLHLAALKGHRDVVETLLKNGARVDVADASGQFPLHEASMQGHVAVVNLLLAKKADINAKQNDGYTPLHWTAVGGNVETAKTLLEHGARLDARAEDGLTPLAFAEMMERKELAEFLRQRGAHE